MSRAYPSDLHELRVQRSEVSCRAGRWQRITSFGSAGLSGWCNGPTECRNYFIDSGHEPAPGHNNLAWPASGMAYRWPRSLR